MPKLDAYLKGRTKSDAEYAALVEEVQRQGADLERQQAITDYNIMMGMLEDPDAEEEEENE